MVFPDTKTIVDWGAAGQCSSKMQQPHRPAATRSDPNLAVELHE